MVKYLLEFAMIAFLIIGDEILSGRTIEGNLPVLAKALALRGLQINEVVICPDAEEVIINQIHRLQLKHSIIFTSGGIGPTHDDKTSAAVARALQRRLVLHQESWAVMSAHFQKRNRALTPARQKMAILPEGALPIVNRLSLAPGFMINGIYVMAGVPQIFEAMLTEVLPLLPQTALTHTLNLDTEKAEGDFAPLLSQCEAEFPGLIIGSYPQMMNHEMKAQLVLKHKDPVTLERAAMALKQALRLIP